MSAILDVDWCETEVREEQAGDGVANGSGLDLTRCIACAQRADMVQNRESVCLCHDRLQFGICKSCDGTPQAEACIEDEMGRENARRVGWRARDEYIASFKK